MAIILLLAGVAAATYVYASERTQVLAAVVTVNEATGQSGVYHVYLYRYNYTGSPRLVVSSTLVGGGSVWLYDPSLLSLFVEQPYLHYSILVVEEFSNGSVAQILDYHWSVPVKQASNAAGTALNAAERVVLTRLNTTYTRLEVNGITVPYMLAPVQGQSNRTEQSAWPITMLHSVGQQATSANNTLGTVSAGSWFKWVYLKDWSVWTVIGEAPSWGKLTSLFTVTPSASWSVTALVSANGGPWSISGSTIDSVGGRYKFGKQVVISGWIATWPPQNLGDGNYYVRTEFVYEEDQLYQCSEHACNPLDEYQIYAVEVWGGGEGWTDAGRSNSTPGSGLTLDQIVRGNYTCTPYPPGETVNITVADGYVYTDAATITQGVVGTPYPPAFTVTTLYEGGVTLTLELVGHTGTYLLYTNGSSHLPDPNQWPVIFTSYTNKSDLTSC